MITDAKVKHYLQKILSSQEFSESKSYADLLEYLEKDKECRKAALDELTDEAQRHGLGY